ncbi:MAG: 3-dehydroquinate synthase [Bryobacteraceae bacterium]|nr:3-dehydroquinate synthase [Bryobacteraceae bacterium]
MVERGAIEQKLTELIPAKAHRLFIITEESVWKLHGHRLAAVTNAFGDRLRILHFPGGESRKRLAEVEALADQMLAAGGDRSSVVIGFGGGIVTDVAGFAAAVFMRGIPVIQVPTTLLAQVDAAVGGKTGVNLVGGKNLVGSFHQPIAVVIDPEVLGTLAMREVRAGLYEVLKHGVIRSPELFAMMEEHPLKILAQEAAYFDKAIAESVRIKCEVVSADEKEGDLRRILNFGHTIGHALEAETRYSLLLHGEAVAFGMRAATHLAVRLSTLAPETGTRINEAIEAYGEIPSLAGVTAEALMARLISDKKTVGGHVHFVLPTEIGATVIRSNVPDDAIRASIEAAL